MSLALFCHDPLCKPSVCIDVVLFLFHQNNDAISVMNKQRFWGSDFLVHFFLVPRSPFSTLALKKHGRRFENSKHTFEIQILRFDFSKRRPCF